MDNYCNIQSVCVLCFIVSMVDDTTRIRPILFENLEKDFK
jgi:hypothetical protein